MTSNDLMKTGLDLYDQGQFFAAHEVWEEVWRSADRANRDPLQALIHVAAAMHHRTKDNLQGACGQIEKASRKLRNRNDALWPQICWVSLSEEVLAALDCGGDYQVRIRRK